MDPVEQYKKRQTTSELGATAHDLLEMKRIVQKEEKQEIKQDLSNINDKDSFDEIVFKMF